MFAELLERLAGLLDDAGIAYMVVGGQAVLLHGEPRLTKDVDVVVRATPRDLPAVLEVVRRCGLATLADPEAFVDRTLVLPCQDPSSGIRVDLIFAFSPFEEEAISRAKAIYVQRREVTYITVEDLVVMKVYAGRARDLDDVRSILLKHPNLDMERVHRWLALLGDAVDEDLLQRFEQLRSSP